MLRLARRVFAASSCFKGILLALGGVAAVSGVAHAEVPAAKRVSAVLVSPASATAYYGSGGTHSTSAAALSSLAPEISALARTLGSELLTQGKITSDQYATNVFTYVRNNISVEFRYGLGEGARGAVIDQSGTPFDQAELMVKLLRAGGVTANYQIGTITLNAQQFGLWSGLVNGLNESTQSFTVDAKSACRLLADGGIPASVNSASDCAALTGNLSTVTLSHIWVSALSKLYDPSYKVHALKAGIDVPAAMGCGSTANPTCGSSVTATALAGSVSGTASGVPYLEIHNTNGIGQQITNYAVSLQNAITSSNPQKKLIEVVGGEDVDVSAIVNITAALPYPSSLNSSWAGEIPDAYRTTLRLQNGGLDITFYSDELAGRQLALTSGGHYALDGVGYDKSNSCKYTVARCTDYTVILTVNHPYAAAGGTYGDEQVSTDMTSNTVSSHGTFPVFIAHALGRETASSESHAVELYEAHPQFSETVDIVREMENPAAPFVTSAYYRNDSMVPALASLLRQGGAMDEIFSGLSRSNITRHHDIGIIYAHPYSPNSMALMSVVSSLSIQSATSDGNKEASAFRSLATQWAMIEGMVNRQVTGGDVSYSAPQMLVTAGRVYLIPASQNTTGPYAGFEVLSSNYPLNANSITQKFKAGYEANLTDLGLKGGANLHANPLRTALDTVKVNEASTLKSVLGDVSLAEGNASFSVTDLTIGAGAEDSLAFTRTYSTGRTVSDEGVLEWQTMTEDAGSNGSNYVSFTRNYSGPDSNVVGRIGGGWTHNYSVFASVNDDGARALGSERAVDAANAIASSQVLLDLMQTSSLSTRATLIQIASWQSQKLVHNTATVDLGGSVSSFARLPDGTFLGSGQDRLVQNGQPTQVLGGKDWSPVALVYTGASGDVINFDWSYKTQDNYCCGSNLPIITAPKFKANTWLKPNGAKVDFQYALYAAGTSWGDNLHSCVDLCSISSTSGTVARAYVLSKVTNNFGHSLTFDYDISSVTQCCVPGSTTSVTRNIDFQLQSVTDETGRAVIFTRSNCPPNSGGATRPMTCTRLSVQNANSQTTIYDYATGTDSPDPAFSVKPNYRLRRIYSASNATTPLATLVYDDLYRLKSIKDRKGNTTSYFPGKVAGSERWKLAMRKTPAGTVTTFQYDDRNNETYSRSPAGRITTKTYNNAGRLLKTVLPEGNGTQNSYDVRGNVTRVRTFSKSCGSTPTVCGDDIITSTSYEEGPTVLNCSNFVNCNKPLSETDARGKVTNYTWNTMTGDIQQILLPADLVGTRPQTDFGYTTYNNISFMTSKTEKISSTRSVATVYAYNSANHYVLQSVTEDNGGLGLTTALTFDAYGNLTAVDGPRTDVNDITYHQWDTGRRIKATITPDPDGAGPMLRKATRYSYDNDNLVTQVEVGTTSATDVITTPANLAVTSRTANTYDAMGNRTQVALYDNANAIQRLAHTSYDADDRPLCNTARLNLSNTGLDACTSGPASADGVDRITKTIYDLDGQTVETKRGVGGANQLYATYTYTHNGQKASEADANGNVTRLIYDGFDRLSAIHYPSPSVTRTGQPCAATSETWCNGSQPYTTRVANDNTAPLLGAASTTDYETFGYDANGNKTAWRRRSGQTHAYTYDDLNRQYFDDLSTGAAADVYTAYDLLGRVCDKIFATNTVTTSNDCETRYTSVTTLGIHNAYDKLGRLLKVKDANSRELQYTYDQASNRKTLTFPDGVTQAYTYNNGNMLTWTGVSATSLGITNGYDTRGRLTSVSRPNGTATGLGYDAIDRINSLSQNLNGSSHDITWAFTYNNVSQIKSLSSNNSVYDYKIGITKNDGRTYDGLNRDTSITAVTGGYDANGNLTSEGTAPGQRTFTYDMDNRLLTAVGGVANLTLTYDPMGRLATYQAGSSTTQFLYDGVNLVGEYNGSTMTRRYLHTLGTDQPFLQLNGSDTGNASLVRYLYTNYQGSVIATADSSGYKSEIYKYGAYGEPTNGFNQTSFTGESRFRYTGQTILPDAQLYYYKARVYDPAMGRFMQTDPIGGDDDLNLYAYVGGDPINGLDPTGTRNLFKRAKTAHAQRELMRSVNGEQGARDMDRFRQYHQDNVTGSLLGEVGGPLIGRLIGRVIGRIAGKGATEAGGTLAEANFAQKTFKATFSEEGQFSGRKVSDVAEDIKVGKISPSDVKLDYIVREGKAIILNTRSAQALEQAGIPKSQWNGVNRTGDSFFEELLSGQLTRNKLGPQGTPTVRPGSGH